MTNREPPVRLNAVAAIMKMGTNSDVARLAAPNLVLLLGDQSTVTRSLATEALGVYCAEPWTCIPPLLKLARRDPNVAVRTQGIKAIWRIQMRFGPLTSNVQLAIEEIAKQDESQVVRSCAERFLSGKEP